MESRLITPGGVSTIVHCGVSNSPPLNPCFTTIKKAPVGQLLKCKTTNTMETEIVQKVGDDGGGGDGGTGIVGNI